MDFTQELTRLKRDVDHEIAVYLDFVIAEAKKTDRFTASLLTYAKKNILAGGKRIRPIMMYWGYCGVGGTDKKEIIRASVSIELIHAFLLMHDDIIDRDDLRRGHKTIHAQYRDYHKRFLVGDDSVHFGVSTGIIAGDFIYALGNQVLFSSQFAPEKLIKALQKMQNIVGLTSVGEMQDVYMEYVPHVNEKDILAMYENKTARYTFDGPLQLGAILAGADDEVCAQMTQFALPLGIAFQIRDDILGVFGLEKKTGKPVGSDIAEGKKTFLVARALKKATKEQKSTLNALLGKKDLTSDDVKTFQDIVIASGAKEEVDAYCDDLLAQAQDAIDAARLSAEAKEFLRALADYLSYRDK